MNIETAFDKLQKSNFRKRFRLSEKDKKYIAEQGWDTIRRHAEDFVRDRLAPAEPRNDGKQTPMRGHPVFVAQHATATCCRGCLRKWWHVPEKMELTPEQQGKIVNFIMAWLKKQCE